MNEIQRIQNEIEFIKVISLYDKNYNELYLALQKLLDLTIKIEKIRFRIAKDEG